MCLRGLRHVYRDGAREHVVLKGVDMDIVRGERVALLGQSGSGKSTLLNLIAGIEPPAEGNVWVAGTELSRLGEHARTLFRRSHIGFVYQFFNLIPTLTLLENVRLPRELNGASPADARRAAADLLARVGLGDRAGAYPEQISGGEQQRVAIARALAHRPALILADEPTGSLDADTGTQVLELLAETARADGSALLMVTHSEAVAQSAQRVLRLRDGVLENA
ncbi:MAG: ABC transporter ATP-binding protein [Acidihalobacter sp.]|uniref:ABC transporter ATP-binding protein n=1 Tax=Acidihalobacter sp. TaxID=1872108 RepID=UPI00307D7068